MDYRLEGPIPPDYDSFFIPRFVFQDGVLPFIPQSIRWQNSLRVSPSAGFARRLLRAGLGADRHWFGCGQNPAGGGRLKPSTQDPNTAALLKTFNDTLWNDLDNAGIFDMVSKSFIRPTFPAAQNECASSSGMLRRRTRRCSLSATSAPLATICWCTGGYMT
jgi:hypothetical protein